MGFRITEEGKARQRRGLGIGRDYKPYILTREINSLGTTTNFVDWKHGRSIQLLSQAELGWYIELRWDDSVNDIREQYPLDLELTLELSDYWGIRHPKNRSTRMTTDFLVTFVNGIEKAYSIKTGRDVLADKRVAELQFLEFKYWEHKGVPWKILYKEDLNKQRIQNIQEVVQYYSSDSIVDNISLIKHLIATKKIAVDLNSYIDYRKLLSTIEQQR